MEISTQQLLNLVISICGYSAPLSLVFIIASKLINLVVSTMFGHEVNL